MSDLESQQRSFAAHLRDPDKHPAPPDIEERRLVIYRDLFFNNIRSFLGEQFPILKNILGDENWSTLVRDFYRDHASSTPLFTELANEFIDYLQTERGEHAEDLPFMLELAHYERIESILNLAADWTPDEDTDPAGDLLSGQPVLSELAWPLSYQWPVHEIAIDNIPGEPAAHGYHFLVYRNPQHKVVFNTLNPVSARLLNLIDTCGNKSGQEMLEIIAGETGQPADTVIEGGIQILEQWRDLGVIAGSRKLREVTP